MKFFVPKNNVVNKSNGVFIFKIPEENELKGGTFVYGSKLVFPVDDIGYDVVVYENYNFNVNNNGKSYNITSEEMTNIFNKTQSFQYKELCNTSWIIEKEVGNFVKLRNELDTYLIAPKEAFEKNKLLNNNKFLLENFSFVYSKEEEESDFIFNAYSNNEENLDIYINYLKELKQSYPYEDWYNAALPIEDINKNLKYYQAKNKIANYKNNKKYEFSAPFVLKKRKQFIVWKWEIIDGKATKVPYNARTLTKASSTNIYTWSTFEDCVKTINSSKNNFDGLGIMLGKGLVGIDFDHCIIDGVLKDEVKNLIDTFGSYTEYSPSGDGIHILLFGQKDLDSDGKEYSCTNKAKGFECYSKSRFFTFTGDVYNSKFNKMLTAKTTANALKKFLETYMKKEKVDIKKFNKQTIILENEKVIEAIRKSLHAKNFSLLYDEGDGLLDEKNLYKLSCLKAKENIQEMYENKQFINREEQLKYFEIDKSKLDMCLASILAKYCSSPAQMYEIFKSSALMREKWESSRGNSTYGMNVCETCFVNRTWGYNPNFYKRRNINKQLKTNVDIKEGD